MISLSIGKGYEKSVSISTACLVTSDKALDVTTVPVESVNACSNGYAGYLGIALMYIFRCDRYLRYMRLLLVKCCPFLMSRQFYQLCL